MTLPPPWAVFRAAKRRARELAEFERLAALYEEYKLEVMEQFMADLDEVR